MCACDHYEQQIYSQSTANPFASGQYLRYILLIIASDTKQAYSLLS